MEDGRSMTTFYYYSVNPQSGLQRNTFSKLSYIYFLIHQNVPQILLFNLIGQKILKLWRQESWPFGPGWSANITRIRSWTFRLPWLAAAHIEKPLHGRSFFCNAIIKKIKSTTAQTLLFAVAGLINMKTVTLMSSTMLAIICRTQNWSISWTTASTLYASKQRRR